MVNSVEFAKRLSEILDYYGITAATFSDLLAVNRSTISHLLSGRNKPSLEFVLKVLNQFPEVELYWLLNGEGHFPTQSKNKTKEVPNLFSEKSVNESEKELIDKIPPDFLTSNSSPQQMSSDFGAIERIVVFYQNGKFKTYTP